jgi:outer membrane protein TolC
MKKWICLFLIWNSFINLQAQQTLSLDSCRRLAMANNKMLLISKEKINSATQQKKAAHTAYLPQFTVSGTYMRNQDEIHLMSAADKTSLGTSFQSLSYLLSKLSGTTVDLTPIASQFANSMDMDTRNIFAGVINVLQPIYTGGKITAYNKIAEYARQLAIQENEQNSQEVIVSIDEAYWQVVSLANKKKLAESYLELLQKLDSDTEKMIAEGVATKADGLSISVKENEAEIALTKVEDGLNLSKMLLCELCGIPIKTNFILADEDLNNLQVDPKTASANIEVAYANRPELKSLDIATNIYKEKINTTRADFLPTVTATGNYIVNNPSFKDGFEKKFTGSWNVGVIVKYPIWHWNEGKYKVNMAKADAKIAQYQLSDAREKIELQVNQSVFKVNEANKKLAMTKKNMEKADENLRSATIGFNAGVIPTSTTLEAHTAWLQAKSEKIDAQIDVKLTELYLQKSLGTITK